MPSCNKVSRAFWWSRFGLIALVIGALLPALLVAAQAAPQAQDSTPPAPAQRPAQPAESSPSPSHAAPTAESQPPQPAARAVRRRVTLDDQVKSFAKSLDLNEAQQVAVKKILEHRQQEILRLRTDGSISGADRIGRLRALQDQTVERIRNVLNDEQKKKYNPLAARQLPPAPDQKSIEDWLKATTPHQ